MNQRKAHLDFLRIFAIILVVFNHTPAFHFPISTHAEVSWSEFFMLCASIADKVAVPLFFMISGALLLAKKETLSTLFRKRVLRMLIVLIIFLLIQNTFFFFVGALTLKQAAFNILKGSTPAWATWFLHAYLAFLLMLPFLRLLVEKLETQHYVYLVILHLTVIEFIPFSHTPLDNWLPFTAHYDTYSNIYLYAIIGYYLEHRISIQDISRKAFCILASASLFAILIGAILTILPLIISGKTPSQCASCFTGAVLIPCIFIYLGSRKLGELTISQGFIHTITALGSGCFTIMLTENIFRYVISPHISEYNTEYFPSIFVTLAVCCCGWVCGFIGKRIPLIKNLI